MSEVLLIESDKIETEPMQTKNIRINRIIFLAFSSKLFVNHCNMNQIKPNIPNITVVNKVKVQNIKMSTLVKNL